MTFFSILIVSKLQTCHWQTACLQAGNEGSIGHLHVDEQMLHSIQHDKFMR